MNIKKQRTSRYITGFIGVFLLIAGIFIHVSVGSSSISITDVIRALLHPDDSKQTTIIQTLRLPRAVLAALIGASLAVAGALMQAITRNSLASPQVLDQGFLNALLNRLVRSIFMHQSNKSRLRSLRESNSLVRPFAISSSASRSPSCHSCDLYQS